MFRRPLVSFVNRSPINGLKGSSRVIDGDTMVVNEERIRVHGIDAPELDLVFWSRGKWLASGPMVMAALEALVAGGADHQGQLGSASPRP